MPVFFIIDCFFWDNAATKSSVFETNPTSVGMFDAKLFSVGLGATSKFTNTASPYCRGRLKIRSILPGRILHAKYAILDPSRFLAIVLTLFTNMFGFFASRYKRSLWQAHLVGELGWLSSHLPLWEVLRCIYLKPGQIEFIHWWCWYMRVL